MSRRVRSKVKCLPQQMWWVKRYVSTTVGTIKRDQQQQKKNECDRLLKYTHSAQDANKSLILK